VEKGALDRICSVAARIYVMNYKCPARSQVSSRSDGARYAPALRRLGRYLKTGKTLSAPVKWLTSPFMKETGDLLFYAYPSYDHSIPNSKAGAQCAESLTILALFMGTRSALRPYLS